MPSVKIDVGEIGWVQDVNPVDLPVGGISEMQNIRIEDGKLKNFTGGSKLLDCNGTPYAMTTVFVQGIYYITWAGNDGVFAYSARQGSPAQSQLTLPDGVGAGGYWDLTVAGEQVIYNKYPEGPMYISDVNTQTGEVTLNWLIYDATDPDAVVYWPDVDMRAGLIRTFKYHLIALDIEDCDGRNRHRVHWSHPFDRGSVPVTWDPTKPNYDARYINLLDTRGHFVDALQLKDTLQIYKTDAIYSMTYQGPGYDNNIFNFRLVTSTVGLFSLHCVVDIGGLHIFLSDSDVYIYDGITPKSIIDKRNRKALFSEIDPVHKDRTFIAHKETKDEVWICISTDSSTAGCDKAYVYNYIHKVWYTTQLPQVLSAVSERFRVLDDTYTWQAQKLLGTTWADAKAAGTRWRDQSTPLPVRDALIFGTLDDRLLLADQSNQEDGVNRECYARIKAVDFGQKSEHFMIKEIRPLASGDPFNFRVGYQTTQDGVVTWTPYQSFDPSTDYRLNFWLTGRLVDFEIQSNADVGYEISGFEVELTRVGEW